ncbi:hypothetical protein F503_04138 [Ophiostoma piceae UAMH 11346]|uniref:Uncharacterized protein n=1 Tax=Ophiostoma piceae (strain UAMH 11346) TaxID=1262450 RepID=S3C9D3_OPHP1|nr:hypothetical protein F503_04138 [Ophiostoma piceae UAMH 11346]
MAYRELIRRDSLVRAPAVYYAFQCNYTKYIVMDHILGKTAEDALNELSRCQAKGSGDEAQKTKQDNHQEDITTILEKVALGLSELHSIPIPSGARPAAVSGGPIRQYLFDGHEAPIHYENVGDIEMHLHTGYFP